MGVRDDFFIPWPIWAKLSFVLGCLIILVLFLAITVKTRNYLKLRAMTSVPTEDRLESGNVEQKDMSSEEIPFGLKAMKEEPEIEGVWNSRNATPSHTPSTNSRRSSTNHIFIRGKLSTNDSSHSSSIVPSDDISTKATVHRSSRESPDVKVSLTQITDANRTGETRSDDAECRSGGPGVWKTRHLDPCRHGSHISSTPRRLVIVGNRPAESTGNSSDSSAEPGSRRSSIPAALNILQREGCLSLHSRSTSLDTANGHSTVYQKHGTDSSVVHGSSKADPEYPEASPSSTKEIVTIGGSLPAVHDPVAKPPGRRTTSWLMPDGSVLHDSPSIRLMFQQPSVDVFPHTAWVEESSSSSPASSVTMPPSAWTRKTQERLDEKLEPRSRRKRTVISNSRSLGKGSSNTM